jgi:transcriptional regulator with XRE-family HTH domain
MRENRELDELALVVVVLRALSGMTQAELAELAGTTASVISEYETGRRRPSRKAVERFAEVLDIPSHKIDGLLPVLRTLRQSTRRSSPGLSEESLALKTARDLESLVVEALGLALMDRLQEPVSSEIEERAKARSVWERLEPLGPTHRQLLVDEGVEFQTWALCELLCHESFEMAEHDREEALELAELAVQVSGKITGKPAWRSRVQGYAWAHLAHARRLQGDKAGAHEALQRYRMLWREGVSAPGELSEEPLRRIEARAAAHPRQSPETSLRQPE